MTQSLKGGEGGFQILTARGRRISHDKLISGSGSNDLGISVLGLENSGFEAMPCSYAGLFIPTAEDYGLVRR